MEKGFVYRWTNALNGKWYIGSHIGTPDDGYIGSGKAFLDAVKKYGIDKFKREILLEGTNIREKEEQILRDLDAANNKMSYNLKNQGTGGSGPCSKTTKKLKSNIAKKLGLKPPLRTGKKNSVEHRRKISESKLGHKHSVETKEKISSALKGRKLSNEIKAKLSDNNSRYWEGRKLSPEHLAKRYITRYYSHLDDEEKHNLFLEKVKYYSSNKKRKDGN